MLTEEEKIILKNTNKYYRYITRDDWGDLMVHIYKPKKTGVGWALTGDDCEISSFSMFNHLFQDVKWTDDEPLEFRNEKGEFIL